jgi:TolB-like protein
VPLSAQEAQPLPTWAQVEAVDGRNILLDDGTILRLGADTTIRRADGSIGGADDLEPGAKIVFKSPCPDPMESVQVFPPRGAQEVYLYDLPAERGGASGAAVPAEGRLWPKSIAALGAAYQRSKYWQRFETRVLYQPMKAEGAPAKAVFAVLDELGASLLEVAVAAGETRHIALGFDAVGMERVVLHVRPAGEGELRQEWCWWLDPHFTGSVPQSVPWTVSLGTIDALIESLAPALAGEQAGKLAVATFSAARGTDQYALQDFHDDLFVAVGQRGAVVAKYSGKALALGEPLSDKDRELLKKLGATSVLLGSVSQRAEGTIINAAVVGVDSGAILATATAKQ